jgi:hypothetical protein
MLTLQDNCSRLSVLFCYCAIVKSASAIIERIAKAVKAVKIKAVRTRRRDFLAEVGVMRVS